MSHPSSCCAHPRRGTFTFLLLSALAGCDTTEPAPQPAAASQAGVAPAAGSGAAGVSEPTLMSLIAAFVAETDRQVEVNCPCLVQMGAYETVEECSMWQHSSPEWVPCSTRALTPYDSPETREIFGCLYQLVKEGGECLATKGCDPVARAECGASPLQCVGEHIDIGVALLNACPDVALLTRQR